MAAMSSLVVHVGKYKRTKEWLVDLSLSRKDDCRLRARLQPVVEDLLPLVQMGRRELLCVLYMHHKLCRGRRQMSRRTFRYIMYHMFTIGCEEITDRIYSAIDMLNANGVDYKGWAELISLFLRGTLDDKILFCFSVYDTLNTGHVTRSEMQKLLKLTIISKGNESEDFATDLADLIVRKFDQDRDGKISFQDYRETVWRNPELLEALGQCLPDREVALSVLSMFTGRVSTLPLEFLVDVDPLTLYQTRVNLRRKFFTSD